MTVFNSGSATHVGQVRQVNQDNVLIEAEMGLFAVADGMGGHRGGEVASEVAIEALRKHFTEHSTEMLVEAVQVANEAVVTKASKDSDLRGMGTTMCALARVNLDGEECLTVVNVGDSRAYLLKTGDSELKQISEDHSLVATLERQGHITHEEAAVHPQRNILTRALGIDQKVLPDSFDLLPVRGDRYVLCSDGLFNEVSEQGIADVLRSIEDPGEAARRLVDLANEGGGRDNVSVVVVDIVDDGGNHVLLAARSDDQRVVHAVHGTERAASAPAGKAKPTDKAASSATASTEPSQTVPPPPPPRTSARVSRSNVTWRVGAFVIALAALVAAVVITIGVFGNSSYFVGVDNGTVAVFRGQPGGVLWIQPQVVGVTEISVGSVPADRAADVARGKEEPTLDEAWKYVDNLRRDIRAQQSRAGSLGAAVGNGAATTTSMMPRPGPAIDPLVSQPGITAPVPGTP